MSIKYYSGSWLTYREIDRLINDFRYAEKIMK